MKILHTADWHLGKTLAGYSLINDQAFILHNLKKLLREENIDILIIAGDIYDKSVPSIEAIRLLDNFLYEVTTETNAKVLAIAGNHDSAARLAFGNRLYQSQGLHIIGEFESTLPKLTFADDFGSVNFFFLPYFSLEKAMHVFDLKFKNLSEAFAAIINHNKPNIKTNERNILIAHGFFSYFQQVKNAFSELDVIDSELPIGGMDIIDIGPAEFFDYIALGHLHCAQKVAKDHIRYAGSLLKYSIAEAAQNKSVTIIELKEKGNLKVKTQQLATLHDLCVISGFIDDITQNPQKYVHNPADYIFAKLKDNDVVDGMFRLRQVFDNVLGLSVAANEDINFDAVVNKEFKQDISGMFKMFFKELTNNKLDDEYLTIVNDVIKDLNK